MKSLSPYMKNGIDAPITETPLIYPDEDLLVVIAGSRLSAYDTNHPAVHGGMGRRWHVDFTGTPKGLMIADGVVYCVLGNELHSYELVNGTSTWHATTWKGGAAALLPPIASGDYLYLIDEQGTQYKVRKQSGLSDDQWGGVIRKGSAKFPPITNGRVLYYNVDHFIVGVDMLSGKEVSLVDLNEGVFTGGWGGAQSHLISPLMMNDRNSFFAMVNGQASNGKNGNFFVGVDTDPNQPAQSTPTYYLEKQSVYAGIQGPFFQLSTVGDSVGLFNLSIVPDPAGFSERAPYGWIIHPYEADGKVKGISIDDETPTLDSGRFASFAVRHQDGPIFCSFLGDARHVLLASGTELQPAEVVEIQGECYFQWTQEGEGYDVGLQMTAPPVIDEKGTLYTTGRDPSDGKYYLLRFRDVSLTAS